MNHATIGIVGQTEYGKTYLTREIIKSLNRVVIIDPKAEFIQGFFVKTKMTQVVNGMLRDRFRMAAQFDSVDEYEMLFIALKQFSNYTLVIDETSLFCSAHACNEDLRQIVQILGSKHRINLIWNVQRPANISRDISSQTHVVASFRVLETADSKYFSRYWRSPAGEAELEALDVGDFRIVRGDKEMFDKLTKNLDFDSKKS